MLDGRDERQALPLQDIDLLTRLSQYFDTLDQQVRVGHGWFIFNATGERGVRVGSYIAGRLNEIGSRISWQFVPWRDFSLNAYLIEVELQSLAQQIGTDGHVKRQFDIAARISRDSMVKLVASDVLVLTGVRPAYSHELTFLDQTVGKRYEQRLPTILVTPEQPHALPEVFHEAAPDEPFWDRLFVRMYERSLIAV